MTKKENGALEHHSLLAFEITDLITYISHKIVAVFFKPLR